MTLQPSRQLQMEDGISCSVCLSHFEDPRILPCQHSYCFNCLQRLVRKAEFDPENPLGGDEIICPRCRRVVSLGDKGVAGLPHNVDLDYAVESLKPILAPSIVGQNQLGPQSPLCNTHRKPLEYFCRECSQPICGDCHVHSHGRHDVCKLEDAIDAAMETLRTNVLDKAETVLLNVSVGIMDVERTIEVFESRKEEMTGMIRERFQRIFEVFHAREQQLVDMMETAMSWKVKNLRDQLDVLQRVKKELVIHVDNLKVAISTPEGVLFLNGSVAENVIGAVQKAQGQRRKPCEHLEDGPHCFIPESVEEMVREMGGVYCKPVPSRFVAQGESLTKAFVGKEGRFSVRAYDQFGQRSYVIRSTLEVVIIGPEGPVNSVTTKEGRGEGGNSPIGQYVVSFVPQCVGVHTVSITVDSVPIAPSTYKVIVFKSRDYLSMDKPTNVIAKSQLGQDVANLRGLSVTPNDQIVFTDGYYVRILDENNALQHTFGGYGTGRSQMNLPLGVAVTKGGKPNSLYVSDSSNHRIQRFSLQGVFQSTFGEQGTQTGQFLNPEGIAVLGNDKLYVADCCNHRIQVFRQNNHKLCHVFGKLGTKPGELNLPRDVTLDLPLNRLLVADSRNNRLQVFSLEGAVLPLPGSRENIIQLEYPPCRVVCDPDSFILVSHMRAVVSVLTPRGELVRYLGAKDGEVLKCLQCSYGICVNSKGELVIVDGSNHSIVVF